jgi:hypothetical protein
VLGWRSHPLIPEVAGRSLARARLSHVESIETSLGRWNANMANESMGDLAPECLVCVKQIEELKLQLVAWQRRLEDTQAELDYLDTCIRASNDRALNALSEIERGGLRRGDELPIH